MVQNNQDVEGSYRKNLMIVAAMISIYSIAGGGFSSELEIAGAKLNFTKPQFLEYTSIIMLIFLWWRHLLVSQEIRRQFLETVVNQVGTPASIKKLIEGRIYGNNANVFDVMAKQIYDSYPDVNNARFVSVGFCCFLYELPHQDDEGKKTNLKYSFRVYSSFKEFFLVNVIYRKAWLSSVIFKPHFGDAVLPSIMTFIALSTYCYNFITR